MTTKIFINIVATLIELITLYELFNRIKSSKKLRINVGIIGASIYIISSIIISLIITNNVVFMILNSLLLLGCTYMFELKLTKRLVAMGFYSIFAMAYELLPVLFGSTFMGISPMEMQQNVELYLLCAMISKFALYITVKILIISLKPSNKTVKSKYIIFNCVMPFASWAILMVLSYLVYESNEFVEKLLILIVSVLLILANIVSYVIYEIIEKNNRKMQQQEVDIMFLKKQKNEYTTLIENQLKSNKEIHEIKHQMFTLKESIVSDTDKALKIVNGLCEIYSEKEMKKFTEIIDVDALLNAKFKYAKAKNIDLVCNIKISKEVMIDSMDICMALGNILDNAIENSMKIEGQIAIVTLDLSTKRNYFVVKSTNSTKNTNVNSNVSTKINENKMHGFGLNKIRDIANKYDGNMDYVVDNGIFTITVILKQST